VKSPRQNSAWGYLSFIGKVDTVFEQSRKEENSHEQCGVEGHGWLAQKLAAPIPARHGYKQRLAGGGCVIAGWRAGKR
jgi:hypothetical protein